MTLANFSSRDGRSKSRLRGVPLCWGRVLVAEVGGLSAAVQKRACMRTRLVRGAGRAAGKPEPDRPWRQQAGGAGGGAGPAGGKPGDKGGGAKRPQMVGPDAELAAQLERDMLDGSPGIK